MSRNDVFIFAKR